MHSCNTEIYYSMSIDNNNITVASTDISPPTSQDGDDSNEKWV